MSSAIRKVLAIEEARGPGEPCTHTGSRKEQAVNEAGSGSGRTRGGTTSTPVVIEGSTSREAAASLASGDRDEISSEVEPGSGDAEPEAAGVASFPGAVHEASARPTHRTSSRREGHGLPGI